MTFFLCRLSSNCFPLNLIKTCGPLLSSCLWTSVETVLVKFIVLHTMTNAGGPRATVCLPNPRPHPTLPKDYLGKILFSRTLLLQGNNLKTTGPAYGEPPKNGQAGIVLEGVRNKEKSDPLQFYLYPKFKGPP